MSKNHFKDGTHETDKAREQIKQAMDAKKLRAKHLAIDAKVEESGLSRFLNKKSRGVSYEVVARCQRSLGLLPEEVQYSGFTVASSMITYDTIDWDPEGPEQL